MAYCAAWDCEFHAEPCKSCSFSAGCLQMVTVLKNMHLSRIRSWMKWKYEKKLAYHLCFSERWSSLLQSVPSLMTCVHLSQVNYIHANLWGISRLAELAHYPHCVPRSKDYGWGVGRQIKFITGQKEGEESALNTTVTNSAVYASYKSSIFYWVCHTRCFSS